MEGTRRKLSSGQRTFLRVIVLLAAAATLALPVALASKRPAKVFAMLAFAFIFHNIMTGALSRPLYRIFKAKSVQLYHRVSGALGFTLGVLHMLYLLTGVDVYAYNKAWIIGPVALVLLAVTMTAALARKKLCKVWRTIHQLNYLIFAGLLVKAFIIGSNLQAYRGLRIVFASYGVMAGLALAYRVYRR
jgi:DMSO/TMAO reductase YedYZ heme-binding membrane subunit